MTTAAGEIKVRVTVVDKVTPTLEWFAFDMWERDAARHGSGLTSEQLTGARVYHSWLHSRHNNPDADDGSVVHDEHA